MAFEDYTLISIKDLADALAPGGNWVLAIQDPAGNVTTKITAAQLGILLNGNIQLPDGVISGLDLTFNNGSVPRTVSVAAGQWRINNGTYNLNAPYVSNINAVDLADRTDAILADDTGDVYYQYNWNGNLVDGTILVRAFEVKADGSAIENSATNPVQYAVMNGNNTGSFSVTTPGNWLSEIYKAFADFNIAARYHIKNSSNGDFATAGFSAENNVGRKIHFLITSDGHTAFGLEPDTAYFLTNGAPLDIIAPELLHNGVPISTGITKIIKTGTADLNGQFTVTGTIPLNAIFTAYDSAGLTIAARYNENTKLVDGLNPNETFKLIFI